MTMTASKPTLVAMGNSRKKRGRRSVAQIIQEEFNRDSGETDHQIGKRIRERFDILEYLAQQSAKGQLRAPVVSGPPGLGKSFTIEKVLAENDPNELTHTVVKGYVKPTGLVKLLYRHRQKGKVLVLDDSDTIFADETSLNMLKSACDSGANRKISYLAEGILIDEITGERVEKEFKFEGTIIFITNLDFDKLIDKGHKFAPHLSAMVSRAHYVDVTLKTKRDYLIRMKQVIDAGMLADRGLTQEGIDDILDFVDQQADSFRELSLRLISKLADIREGQKADSTRDWRSIAKITCCR